MNENTKQLLKSVGYDYPEYAVLAQKLVQALAADCVSMATANNEPNTSQQITTKFLTADQPVPQPAPQPAPQVA